MCSGGGRTRGSLGRWRPPGPPAAAPPRASRVLRDTRRCPSRALRRTRRRRATATSSTHPSPSQPRTRIRIRSVSVAACRRWRRSRRVSRMGEAVFPLPGAERTATVSSRTSRARLTRTKSFGCKPRGGRRVDGAQACVERRPAVARRRAAGGGDATLVARGGRLGQPEEQRLDPQERPAANDWDACRAAHVVDGRDAARRPGRSVRVLERIERVTRWWGARARSACVGLPEPTSKPR